MHNQPLKLPIYYMAQIKEQLDFWQKDSNVWLQQNHLTANQLANSEETINFATYESLILSAITMAENDALGLYIGERIGITSHGMLGFALLNCSSIREAMAMVQEYINTRTPFISIEIAETTEDFKIIFKEIMPFETIKRTFLEAMFVTFHNILSQLTFSALKISSVHFNYASPHYADQYSNFFDCPIEFNQTKNEMHFAAKMLNIPLRLADPISLKQARQLCDAELAKMANNFSPKLSHRVREMLLNSVGHFPTLEKTAFRFHVGPRTLHRHLKSEGTSYRQILENVSHTIASQQLTNTSITVEEISLLLGYIDVANFRRAFKRWTGMTPSDYRTNNRN
ncbi:AraC family transcriptional regulator [uncultured Paraglaciecola sp.]|uniref:AraC family transcriptional regulator n=1 Tax=uncultured Paraglaciecola sp. TaxID=1765024 RepID=UPI0025E00B32|nr:AraC family transcriptional regulator [uncultured Paraglaciecola sp.]